MLRTFTDVRPEERRGVVGAFLALFGILAGHTLLETARDALFLARLPPSKLPWVYLAIAGLLSYLRRYGLGVFVAYRIVFGLVALALLASRSG